MARFDLPTTASSALLLDSINGAVASSSNVTTPTRLHLPLPLPGLLNAHQYALFTKIYVGLWLTISLFGTWSNIINLRTFFKMERSESIIILFIILSLTDFSNCVFSSAESISTVVEIIGWGLAKPYYISPIIVNVYLSIFRRMFSVIAVLTTIILAVQRCICVIFPFRVRGMFTPVRTCVIVLAPSGIMCLLFFIYASSYKTAEVTNPISNITFMMLVYEESRFALKAWMSVVTGIFINVSAQVIILSCLVVMGHGLRKAMQFKKSAVSADDSGNKPDPFSKDVPPPEDKQNNKMTQALVQVMLLAAIFVISNTPFLIIAIVTLIQPEIDLYKRYHHTYIVLFRMIYTCELINSSINFFVYYNYNSKFRKICFGDKPNESK